MWWDVVVGGWILCVVDGVCGVVVGCVWDVDGRVGFGCVTVVVYWGVIGEGRVLCVVDGVGGVVIGCVRGADGGAGFGRVAVDVRGVCSVHVHVRCTRLYWGSEMLAQDLWTQCGGLLLQVMDIWVSSLIWLLQRLQMWICVWFGPGLVSISPAKRIRCPGVTPASACLSGNSCHPPSGERGQPAEKTAVLGPPCGGQGCVVPIWVPKGTALQPRAGRNIWNDSFSCFPLLFHCV